MRPGRLDRILYVGPPDLEGRIEILKIRTNKMAIDPALDLEQLAEQARLLCSVILQQTLIVFTAPDCWLFRSRAFSTLSRRCTVGDAA